MTRLFYFLLFLIVPILGCWTFVIAADHGWWFPENHASFGGSIDGLFDLIMWLVAVTFVGTEVVLAWCILRFPANKPGKSIYTHGNHRLELLWTAVPAVVLAVILFAQMEPWVALKYPSQFPDGEFSIEQPFAEVTASQFDWRMRYPDENGSFDSEDVVENAFELVVPVNTPIVIILKSRDVLHSFFIPNLRTKQDAVPGMDIPVWFDSDTEGEFDLICAELCGWGHYKMAGRITVVSREEYDAWLAGKRAELYSNGTEDLENQE